MRCAYLEELGPWDRIRYGELPDPEPGATDVLVDVQYAAVNHVDTFVRSGAWRTPVPLPFVIGRDLVGTVARPGPGAPGFAKGDPVWCLSMGYAGRQGAAAERAVVPADRLLPLPEGVDPVDAVALAHPGATAYLALFVHGRLRPGETVLVLGAGGNVGSAVVTMAVAAGARVVTVSGARDLGHCRDMGAAAALDYRSDGLYEQVRAAAPEGVGLCVDASGHNDVEQLVELLARRGRLVLLAGMRTRPVLPVGPLYLLDRSVIGFAASQATADELAAAARHIGRLAAAGTLRPRRTEVLPLSAAGEAHRRLEAGEGGGRRFVLRTAPAAEPEGAPG